MTYYVYRLVDPRTRKTFYIGKGKDKRCHDHVKQARRGGVGFKCDVIREIIAASLTVQIKIVREFEGEDEAFAYEKQLIDRIGLENLTNIMSGGREMSFAQVQTRSEMRRLIRSMSRMAKVLARYKEVGWRFCGKWYDLARTDVIQILSNGVQKAFDCLGESEANAEFMKYGVSVQNKT